MNSSDDIGSPGHFLNRFIYLFFCFERLFADHKFSFFMPFRKIDQCGPLQKVLTVSTDPLKTIYLWKSILLFIETRFVSIKAKI